MQICPYSLATGNIYHVALLWLAFSPVLGQRKGSIRPYLVTRTMVVQPVPGQMSWFYTKRPVEKSTVLLHLPQSVLL